MATQVTDDPSAEHIDRLIERNFRQVEQDYAAAGQIELSHLGVVGAGMMGARIAAFAFRSGLSVTVVDRDPEAVRDGPRRVDSVLRQLGDSETPRPSLPDDRLQFATDYSAFAGCDLVIESVPEKPPLKMAVFSELQQAASPTAVLATNTSTIPIGNLAGTLDQPQRLCGLHFFMPLGKQWCVEVIPGPQTAPQTVATGIAFCRRIQHMPLIVRDGPGFVVNRMLMSFLSAGLDLVLAGVDLVRIERVASEFGLTMGPFQAYDEIGLDVAFHSGFIMAGTAERLVVKSPLLVRMVKAGHLGRKAGRGFFDYSNDPNVTDLPPPNPDALEIIRRFAEPASSLTDEAVVSGLVLPMVLEAARLLDEGRARDACQIDLGATLALGFPRSQGGLLYWADGLGAARIIDLLEPLKGLSQRYQASETLLDMAAHNRRFYDATS